MTEVNNRNAWVALEDKFSDLPEESRSGKLKDLLETVAGVLGVDAQETVSAKNPLNGRNVKVGGDNWRIFGIGTSPEGNPQVVIRRIGVAPSKVYDVGVSVTPFAAIDPATGVRTEKKKIKISGIGDSQIGYMEEMSAEKKEGIHVYTVREIVSKRLAGKEPNSNE